MTNDTPGPRILLVEDNAANMELARYLLEAHGFVCEQAVDAEAALALLARAAPPDLVLCDLHLPGMDGFALLAALRNDSRLAGVPVVAVTAYAMVGDRSRVLAAGFSGYIAKPLDPCRFVAQVSDFLGIQMPLPTIAGGHAVIGGQ
jgi:two-component system, cell cycle response regulator